MIRSSSGVKSPFRTSSERTVFFLSTVDACSRPLSSEQASDNIAARRLDSSSPADRSSIGSMFRIRFYSCPREFQSNYSAMELLPSLATALRQPIAPAHLAESPPVKQRSLSVESAPASGEDRNVPDSNRGARGGPSRVAVRLAVSQ